jgi:hypothetical protein
VIHVIYFRHVSMPQSSEPVLFPAHEINHVHLQNNVLAMTKDELITGGFLIIPSEKFSIKVKYGSYLIHESFKAD